MSASEHFTARSSDAVRDGRQLMENDYGVDSCYLPALGELVSVPHRWSGRFGVDIAPAVDARFDAPPHPNCRCPARPLVVLRRRRRWSDLCAPEHPNYRYQPQGDQ